jgi:hypothetical protein
MGGLIGLAKFISRNVVKNAPAILTGLGVVGLISTVVSAVQATPRALTLMEEAEKEKNEPLTTREIVETTWKCYIPTLILGGVSIACIIGSNSVHAGRKAALVSLYKITEKTLKEYRSKVKEVIGDKKEDAIRDKISGDKVIQTPYVEEEVLITGKGETLCYDEYVGRYFRCDIEVIRQAINKLNRDMMTDHTVTLNDLYSELNLRKSKLGDITVWHIDDGLIDPHFSSHLTDQGKPCLVMDFYSEPRYGYNIY